MFVLRANVHPHTTRDRGMYIDRETSLHHADSWELGNFPSAEGVSERAHSDPKRLGGGLEISGVLLCP